jgi:hypothetical protein
MGRADSYVAIVTPDSSGMVDGPRCRSVLHTHVNVSAQAHAEGSRFVPRHRHSDPRLTPRPLRQGRIHPRFPTPLFYYLLRHIIVA